jgi:hypothetical protein
MALGLAPPPPSMQGLTAGAAPPFSTPQLPAMSGGAAATVLDTQRNAMAQQVASQQASPIVTGLSGHIKKFWTVAQQAKLTIEQQLLEALYARRGEYTATKQAQIIESKQPLIYMMVAGSKMRQVDALLRDILLGAGSEKPWAIHPTPAPELPPAEVQSIVQLLQNEIVQFQQIMGGMPDISLVRDRMQGLRDELDAKVREDARTRSDRMEHKMEDQLTEGGIQEALDQFISDLSTFKTAFLKGPVVRKKPKLAWGPDGSLSVTEALALGWERTDPFMMYPAPWARTINEGPLIERHRLTRDDLNQMIGVDGYNEAAIRKVLDEYGLGGLHNWRAIDSQKAIAEGKSQIAAATNSNELIDALQYWGSASGQHLRDWGMTKAQIPDPNKEYQIEAWLIGPYVIKAVLNADPLARRPYYAASFQTIPGSVWGNCPYDLMHDCQDMCNAAARSLAANLGIASGPQVAIISSRLPPGEEVTDMFPWKIWQFEHDPMGSTAKPIEFFQPQSNAAELMQVYEKFSVLADEYTGIPRYMSGFNEGAGGAGRTASGMSMMIGNASKIIKQVLSGIDVHVWTPMLERLYYYNMRYGDDPDLKGDIKIVARGAVSLQIKDAAQVRRNEFLQQTMNPVDMQIVGLDGRAEVLRETAKGLDLNVDRVVPSVPVLKQRMAAQAAQQQQAMLAAAGAPAGAPAQQQAKPQTPAPARGNGQALMDHSPMVDNFSPKPQP